LPYPSSSGEGYLDRLLYIKSAHGLDVVVPNLDAELPFYIKYASQLALVVRSHDEAAMHEYKSTRYCKGINAGVFDHNKLKFVIAFLRVAR